MRDDSRGLLWIERALSGLGNEVDAAIRRAAETKYEGDQILIENALTPWLEAQCKGGYDGQNNAMFGWKDGHCSPSDISECTKSKLSFEDLDNRGKAASILFERVQWLAMYSRYSIPNCKQVDKILFGKDTEELINMIRKLGGILPEGAEA